MISLTLFVALSCLATRVFADDEVNDPDVVVLGADNFDKIAVDTPTLLVEFYAPWCGHCKRLAPEYAVAATALLKEDPPVVLGKVDATIHGELAEKYGVQGYPTLKIFRNGVASEYNGPRDSAGIIKYMRAQSGPAARVLADAAALDAFTASSSASDEVVHVAFVDEGSDEEAAFLAVANRRRDDFRFGVASGADVLKAAGVAAPAVVAFRPASFESTRQEFAGDYTTDNIDAFVVQSALPLAGVYDQSNAKQYALAGLPRVTVWTRVDMVSAPKQARYYLNRLKKVAAGYVGKAKFVLEDKTAREFADLGFDGAAEFGLGAIDADGRKYRSDISKFSVDALDAFAQAFVAGELEVYMKSEPVPESQDDAVITVVGKTFEELVHDENKDVLIEFYAPWCGHCKSLTPKYEELATQMSEHSTVRIAKIDATANDVPPEYNVRGFPTIYLQKNDGSAPVAYEGAREVADFKKFLKKNVSRKLSKKASKEEL